MGVGQGPGRDYLNMSHMVAHDAQWAFDAYERARPRLPRAVFPAHSRTADTLSDIADDYDVFLLDAFGVLNVGETAIPGAVARMAELRRAGKRLLVMTNGATHPADTALAKYHRLGFDFSADEVISSRDALTRVLTGRKEAPWGVMAIESSRIEELGVPGRLLADDPSLYAKAEGFILLGSGEWTENRQLMLVNALKNNPRPVLVGNPDIIAPRENAFSLEPGYFAHSAADAAGIDPVFFGKPFDNIYDLALELLGGAIPRDRILMVGDSLHTDILGGAAAGIATALVTDFGFFKGVDPYTSIIRSGIVPDLLISRP